VHVTFLHPAIDFSDGTERLQASVRAALAADHRVSVVAGGGTRLESLLDAGAEVHAAELPDPNFRGFFAARRTRLLLRELAPDLLHATDEKLSRLTDSLGESLRIPYVLEMTHPVKTPVLKPSVWMRAVILPCATLVESAVNRGQASRAFLRVIEHGPQLTRHWTPRRLESAAQPTIANLGTLDETHGSMILVEAARLLEDAGRKLRYLVLGEGPVEDALRQRVRELGLNEVFTITCPALPDLGQVLGEIDVHVSCVTSGSPGWCAVHALGMGLPSIFSAVSCAFPLVEDHRNGLLVERGNPAELAAGISTLLDDPESARGFGAAARKGLLENQLRRRYADELTAVHEAALQQVAPQG